MVTAAQEQDKYRRIWEVPGYRVKSPGELLVPTFLEHAAWNRGDTLIDLGCGAGRAGLQLSKAGLEVTLMDITRNAIDLDSRGMLPFVQHCLWEPTTLRFDWAYCCDVLEHIPPEWVNAVLENLSRIGTNGAFMQIALFKDGFGGMIGETLHLTIETAEWWMEKITSLWPIEYQAPSGDGRLIVLTGPAHDSLLED